MQNWSEKHRPRSLEEVVGNRKAVRRVGEWGENWSSGDRPLLLRGPAGTGKTSTATALASDLGFDLVEMNASDVRTADAVTRVGGSAAYTGTLTSGTAGRRLVLIDEVDNLHGNSDRGGGRAMTELVKNAEQPVIMVCNDVYGVPRGVRSNSEEIEFKRLGKKQVEKALSKICAREELVCEREALQAIAGKSSGDLRSAVNDLQALASDDSVRVEDVRAAGRRDRETSIFDALDDAIKGSDVYAARNALFSLDETPEDLVHWVDENMVKVLSTGELADAYGYLVRADVFLGRTRRTGNYTFWGYATELIASVGQANNSRGKGWTPYGFPGHWSRMGRTKRSRTTRSALCRKVSKRCHASTDEVRDDMLPFIEFILTQDTETGVRIVRDLGLEEDEVEFIAGEGSAELLVETPDEPVENDGPGKESGGRYGTEENQLTLTDF
ncbi:MAG: Replication factor C large subunit [Methanonatronarchaeales archaeon]|nr:Replication factor C large subunit [Methanonatronarchaeales archaeon]